MMANLLLNHHGVRLKEKLKLFPALLDALNVNAGPCHRSETRDEIRVLALIDRHSSPAESGCGAKQ
jgi:hypothetical protein